jgi:hypothetical protein
VYVQPTAPRPIGGVIDDAIKLYRASFRTCWKIALISSVLGASMTVYVFSRFPALITVRDPAQLWELFKPSEQLGTIFIPILVSLLSLLLIGAVIACQNAVAAGRGLITLPQALSAAVGQLHRILLALVLSAIFIGTVIAVAVLPAGVALRILAVLLWVILAIYVWGRLQLWMVALFAEDASTFRALGISWSLIEGHWWRSAMILTVGIVIVLVIGVVFGALAGLLLLGFRLDPMSLIMANQAISAVERVFVTPMIPAVMVAMYHDFKLRREGGDLAARTKSLQSS